MHDGLREVLASREGHFLMESGHHGSLWLQLDALFLRPEAIDPLVDGLTEMLKPLSADVVCGPLLGGAVLSYQVAARLKATFVYSARTAHVPGEMYSASYEVPTAQRPALQGARVIVVDDVVNAGSASRSTLTAVRQAGGEPVGLAALLQLGDGATALASSAQLPFFALEAWPSPLWEPAACPKCTAGLTLDNWGS